MPKKKKKIEIVQKDTTLELIRLELVKNRCNIEEIEGIPYTTILEEIAYTLNPEIHEGRIPPYGSILCHEGFADELIQQRNDTKILDKSFMRRGADGRRTYLLYSGKADPELCSFIENYESELDLIKLSRSCAGVILKRRDSGLTTLVYKRHVFTIQNRRWVVREPISQMVGAISQHYPDLEVEFTRRILELCCYILSPLGIGATLVWFILEPTAEEAALWKSYPDLRVLDLHAVDEDDYQEIAHLARHHDGAFLLGPQGEIRSLGAHLTYTPETAGRISPYRGTRHTSAKYYSFEHDRTLIFVVSEDGYVSTFSDGVKISDSPLYPAYEEAHGLRKMAPMKAKDVFADSFNKPCIECGKLLRIEQVTIIGCKELEEAYCPFCGKIAHTAMCWSLEAFPLKILPKG